MSSAPLPPRTASDSEPLRDEDARTHTWGWSIGAQAGLTEGVTPGALLSIPGFVEIWRRAQGLWSPAFRLRFEQADGSAAVATSPGSGAAFTWTAGSLDVCPIALATRRIRAWPCVRGEGGALAATGTGVDVARTSTRPWLTFGLLARIRATVVGSLFVEVEGGALAPVVRDRFFLEPSATVQHVPVVAAAGAAGGGVTFW